MKKRIVCNFLMLVSFMFLPWYVTAFFVVLFIFLFHRFWEGIALAFLADSVYAVSWGGAYGRFGIFIASAIVVFFLLEKFKKQLRF